MANTTPPAPGRDLTVDPLPTRQEQIAEDQREHWLWMCEYCSLELETSLDYILATKRGYCGRCNAMVPVFNYWERFPSEK